MALSLPCSAAECFNSGTKPCIRCYLVAYCGETCQRADQNTHQKYCQADIGSSTLWEPSWGAKRRRPGFTSATGAIKRLSEHFRGRKTPWGDFPALNMLQIEKNEGASQSQDIRMLFAASADLRNVVKTVVELPQSYSGTCEIVLNDEDRWLVSRNVILLLVALKYEPKEAAETMLHLWYSAFIPKAMLKTLRHKVLPLLEEVSVKTKDKTPEAPVSHKWKCGSSSLRLVLQKRYWDALLQFFEDRDYFPQEVAQLVRTANTLPLEARDYREQQLYACKPMARRAHMKFWDDGLLLPFGSSTKDFNTPNPLLFRHQYDRPIQDQKIIWPINGAADPLAGWPQLETRKLVLRAKMDVYGRLYHYLLGQFEIFARKIKDAPFKFHYFNIATPDLPPHLSQYGLSRGTFDRVDASNLADSRCRGLATTFLTFGPLLKHRKDNPHATLLTLFVHAVSEVQTPRDTLDAVDKVHTRVSHYLSIVTDSEFKHDLSPQPDSVRFRQVIAACRDYNQLWDRWASKMDLSDVAKKANLRQKQKNTIVEPWPFRIPKDASYDEFWDMFWAGGGSERCAEWSRID